MTLCFLPLGLTKVTQKSQQTRDQMLEASPSGADVWPFPYLLKKLQKKPHKKPHKHFSVYDSLCIVVWPAAFLMLILFRMKQATVNGDKLEKKHPYWQQKR